MHFVYVNFAAKFSQYDLFWLTPEALQWWFKLGIRISCFPSYKRGFISRTVKLTSSYVVISLYFKCGFTLRKALSVHSPKPQQFLWQEQPIRDTWICHNRPFTVPLGIPCRSFTYFAHKNVPVVFTWTWASAGPWNLRPYLHMREHCCYRVVTGISNALEST
jgi:hypothetical protein